LQAAEKRRASASSSCCSCSICRIRPTLPGAASDHVSAPTRPSDADSCACSSAVRCCSRAAVAASCSRSSARPISEHARRQAPSAVDSERVSRRPTAVTSLQAAEKRRASASSSCCSCSICRIRPTLPGAASDHVSARLSNSACSSQARSLACAARCSASASWPCSSDARRASAVDSPLRATDSALKAARRERNDSLDSAKSTRAPAKRSSASARADRASSALRCSSSRAPSAAASRCTAHCSCDRSSSSSSLSRTVSRAAASKLAIFSAARSWRSSPAKPRQRARATAVSRLSQILNTLVSCFGPALAAAVRCCRWDCLSRCLVSTSCWKVLAFSWTACSMMTSKLLTADSILCLKACASASTVAFSSRRRLSSTCKIRLRSWMARMSSARCVRWLTARQAPSAAAVIMSVECRRSASST